MGSESGHSALPSHCSRRFPIKANWGSSFCHKMIITTCLVAFSLCLLLSLPGLANGASVVSENDLMYSVATPNLSKHARNVQGASSSLINSGASHNGQVLIPVLDTSQMDVYEHPKSASSRPKKHRRRRVYSAHRNFHRKRQIYAPLDDQKSAVRPQHAKESGPWGQWNVARECSRTCGGGVLIESRDCADGHQCTGQKKRYVSCNIQDCPDPDADFRAEQCAQHNDQPFEGKYYKWLPYTKAPNRCELNCIPQGANFFYRKEERVVDGTPCDAMTNDICVDGFCLPVGCDKKLGSIVKEDKCRICGGNGTSCKTVEGLLGEAELDPGYHEIVTIPVGATSIHIVEQRPTNNYIALKNSSDHYYLNGAYKIDFPQTLRIAGTAFEYDRTKQGNLAVDKMTANGPTTEPISVMLLSQTQNVGVRYEYSVPLDDSVKYEWRPEAWSDCSVSCGQGIKTRSLQCHDRSSLQIVSEEKCANSSEPETNKTCNTVDCPADWFIGEWEECSASCGEQGVQFRIVYCHRVDKSGTQVTVANKQCEGRRPPVKQRCNRHACPEWYAGPWSACSKQCGEAEQFRSVSCRSARDDEDNKLLPESDCSDEGRPNASRKCNLGPCKGLKWVTTEWKLCKKCNDTTETRNVTCQDGNLRKYPDEKCVKKAPKPEGSRSCLKVPPCNYQWHASQWSKCSTKCGHGHQTRGVFCAIEENGSVRKMDEFHCDGAHKLPITQNCTNEEDCTGTWFTGPWETCSVSCDGGTRKRAVLCFDYDFKLTNIDECDERKKPNVTEECNKDRCLACNETEFGCCPDNSTAADGWYFKGCSNCSTSEFGCCPDNITDATGPDLAGCGVSEEEASGEEPLTECKIDEATGKCEKLCNYTNAKGVVQTVPCVNLTEYENVTKEEDLLEANATAKEPDCKDSKNGCCPDWKTPAEGENNEGCPAYVLGACQNSTNETWPHGCCPDNVTLARGPQFAGCGDSTCAASLYGCCSDRHTIAFGPHYQGCEGRLQTCENSKHGCCPDGRTTALGPNGKGCEENCYVSNYGCCPDGKVAAKGPGFAGCGCTYSQYGCCPDGKSDATGPQFHGCPDHCATTAYGCCPDGKTAAEGPNRYGCPCEYTEFGCCIDGETAALGPNNEGCDDCRRSKFGCCPDGHAKATGPHYQGCFEEPQQPQQPGHPHVATPQHPSAPVDAHKIAACGLPNDLGTLCLQQYLLRWYYNAEFGSCTQFWYGGCEGNENRFETQQECHNTCVDPPGEGVCHLPKVEGSDTCPDKAWRYFWDAKAKRCLHFLFRCNGNKNNFESYEECENRCGHLLYGPAQPPPSVEQPRQSEPEPTVSEVRSHPGQSRVRVDPSACFLTADSGPCKAYNERWFYDHNARRCEQFVYGGCRGNENRFETYEECEENCAGQTQPPTAAGETRDICGLPVAKGHCQSRFARWYFEKAVGQCEVFYYSGCGGNENRFETIEACEGQCVRRRQKSQQQQLPPENNGPLDQTTEPTNVCQLRRDAGPCDNYEARWSYNATDGTCTRFYYGGCDGNGNRFLTEEECVQQCAELSDPCVLPVVTGPCRGHETRFYYDAGARECRKFVYGGCLGNKNRFSSAHDCASRCQPGAAGSGSPQGRVGQVSVSRGSADEHGLDNEVSPDANPTEHPEDETESGEEDLQNDEVPNELSHRRHDHSEQLKLPPAIPLPQPQLSRDQICELPKDVGPCKAFLKRWHYNAETDQCELFHYGGCGGNRNNFHSTEDCQRMCVSTSSSENRQIESSTEKVFGIRDSNPARPPQPPVRTYPLPTSLVPDLCKQRKDEGGCYGDDLAWFFDTERATCSSFKYTGCGGNTNRFDNEEACERACGQYRDQNVCALEYDVGPCLSSVQKWTFNSATRACETFIYGGCLGNGNRFNSKEDCENLCRTEQHQIAIDFCQLSKSVGPCQESIRRWFYDTISGACAEFVYGGCEGNANNFASREECENSCLKGNNIISAEEICKLERDAGPCLEPISMWYHDAATKQCKPFTYGGCRGNANRFENKHECEIRCAAKPPQALPQDFDKEEVCRLPFEQGPCHETFGKWYYDGRRKRCLSFTYGGCYGNENRFDTREECEHTCKGVFVKSFLTTPRPEDTLTAKIEVEKLKYKQGEPIVLRCVPAVHRADVTGKRITVFWFKNGQRLDLTESERYKDLTNGTLKISHATPSDNAQFRCALRHGRGVISDPVNLTIQGSEGAGRAHSTGSDVCKDEPSFANCKMVVSVKLCDHVNYGRFCCASCRAANDNNVKKPVSKTGDF